MVHRLTRSASFAIGLLASAAAFGQTSPPISTADQQFVKEAAIGGQFEVAAGKLAAQSANPEVRAFGQKMVQDHTAADAQLQGIVKPRGVALPKGLDAEHRALRDHLASLKGAAFDREYIALMVKDHDEDTKVFSDEERDTADPQIKQFAEQTLTVVKAHDQMARQIAGTMGIKVGSNADRG